VEFGKIGRNEKGGDMADIAAIVEALSGVRNAIDIVRFLQENTSSIDETTNHRKLADLMQLLVEIRGQLSEARTVFEITELEENFQSKDSLDSLVKMNDAYYEIDSKERATGDPYCMHCWETERRKHHLHNFYQDSNVNICSICETKYLKRRTMDIYRGGL
jgi:hypothetical protein